jgi:hypothetical protein
MLNTMPADTRPTIPHSLFPNHFLITFSFSDDIMQLSAILSLAIIGRTKIFCPDFIGVGQ